MFCVILIDNCDMMQNYCVNFLVHDHTIFDSVIAVYIFMERLVSPH